MSGKKENKKTGNAGEALTAQYLESTGCRIIERNFRAGRMGEIDIIAEEGDFLCFIEVKTRKGLGFGMPSEAVNRLKQKKLTTIALVYLKLCGKIDANIRFDVAEVLMEDGKRPRINLIKNAF